MFLRVAFTAREASFIFFLTLSESSLLLKLSALTPELLGGGTALRAHRMLPSPEKKKDLKLSLNKQSEVLKKIPTAELGDAVFYSQTCPAGCRSVIEFSCVTASTCIRPLDLDSGTSRCFPQLGASVYKMENQSPHQPNLKTGRSRSHSRPVGSFP